MPWVPMNSRIDQTQDYLMVERVDYSQNLNLILSIFERF